MGDFRPIEPNPYIVGNPIRDRSMFFGREEDLKFLHDRVDTEGRETIVLCGGRRSGKTSILLQILGGRLGERFLPVLVDMQQLAELTCDGDLWSAVARRVVERMAEGGLDVAGLAAPEPDVPDSPSAFRRFLEAAAARLGNRKLLILVDEYELIEEHVHAGVLTPEATLVMASILDSLLPVSFIFTGSRRIQERDPVVWSRLMSKALHRRISFLALADAERLVREPVCGRVDYENGAVRAILRLTAGHPFYTQVVCQSLVDRLNERKSRTCTVEDVDAVAESIADNPLPQMVYWWKSMSFLERVVAALVAGLAGDAEGFVGAEAVEADLGAHKKEYGFVARRASVRGAIERLIEVEDLEAGPHRDVHRFRMDLARRWIRVEHPVWEVIRELDVPGADLGGVRPLGADARRRWAWTAVAVVLTAAAAGAAALLAGDTGDRTQQVGTDAAAGGHTVAGGRDAAGPPAGALYDARDGGVAEPMPPPAEGETRTFSRYFLLRNQLPEPLGVIAEDDLAGRTDYFVFTYRSDRLVRFEHLNGSGHPGALKWEDDEWWENTTTVVPEYRADGTVERLAAKRCAAAGTDGCVTLVVFVVSADLRSKRVVLPGSELPTWTDTGISVFEYDLDETGRPAAVRFKNALGKPQPDAEGRIAVRYVYDETGWIVEEHEEILGGGDDAAGGAAAPGKKTRVIRYVRDAAHNPIEIALFDGEGRPIRFPEGTAWETAHRIVTEWDDRERPILYRFYGPSGDPVRFRGSFVVRVQYDDRGNTVRRTFLDLEGKPAPADRGTVYEEYEYDRRGLPTLQRRVGRGGVPVERTIQMRWNDSGDLVAYRLLDETLRGDDGKPIVVKSRLSEFDDLGRRVVLRVLDGDGKPVAPDGYAVVRYEYDAHGAQVRRWYEGLDGKPAAPTRGEHRGVSSIIAEYDDWGFLVARRYRDAGGEPVASETGAADFEWERDPAGRVLAERTIDAAGHPAPHAEWPGSLVRKFRYDSDGNVVEERAWDADGDPVPAATGEYIVRRAYDHLARIVEELMLDADGAPMMAGPYGVARMTKTYAPLGPGGACWTDSSGAVRCAVSDAGIEGVGPTRGTVVETRFYDARGRPAASAVHGRGIARVVAVTDAEDRLIEIRYLDAGDRPTANRQGVHMIRTTWSDAGRVEETSYGVDGLPVQPAERAGSAFARRTWAYDELGQEIEYRTFGRDGRPWPDARGIAARVRTYHGERIVEERFLGSDGNLHPGGDGVARTVWEYDPDGRIAREMFLDASGIAVAMPEWVADLRVAYDRLGRPARFDLEPAIPMGSGRTPMAGVAVAYEGANAVARPLDAEGRPMVVDGVAALRYPKAEWGEPMGCVGDDGLPLRCAPGTELLLRFLATPVTVTCPTGSPGAGDDRCSWM